MEDHGHHHLLREIGAEQAEFAASLGQFRRELAHFGRELDQYGKGLDQLVRDMHYALELATRLAARRGATGPAA